MEYEDGKESVSLVSEKKKSKVLLGLGICLILLGIGIFLMYFNNAKDILPIDFVSATNEDDYSQIDVQFMTCSRVKNPEYVPEVIEQKTTVKLPVTFDTTITLLIILGVIILAIIALLIAKKQLNKNDKK